MADLDRLIRELDLRLHPEKIDPVFAYKKQNQPITFSQGFVRCLLRELQAHKRNTDKPQPEPEGRRVW